LIGVGLGSGDRGKESGGTTTNDDCFSCHSF
jgi:hypothetical protein